MNRFPKAGGARRSRLLRTAALLTIGATTVGAALQVDDALSVGTARAAADVGAETGVRLAARPLPGTTLGPTDGATVDPVKPVVLSERSSVLVLSVAADETAPSVPPVAGTAVLHCDPVGGSHPTAATACSALEAVDGSLADLTGDDARRCTLRHEPVTVALQGVWRGRVVEETRTFGNRCELIRVTGDLFVLDRR